MPYCPTTGDPTKGMRIPRDSDFEGQQDLIQNFHRTEETETLGRHKQNRVLTKTQEKGAVTPQETEPDLAVSIWEFLEEAWVDSGLPWGQGHQLAGICLFGRLTFWSPLLPLPLP